MLSHWLLCTLVFGLSSAYPSSNSEKESRDGTTININKFFDQNLPDMRPIIKQLRFDPMPLPNITDDIAGVHIELTNGLMFGAANLTRAGNVSISFYRNSSHFEAKIHIYELKCQFNYLASTAFGYIKTEGDLNATVKNVTASLGMDFSMATLTINKPVVHIEDYGLVSVTMGANSVAGALRDLFVNLALPFFQSHIIDIAESTALQIANVTLQTVNENIRRTVQKIDQYLVPLVSRFRYALLGYEPSGDLDKVFAPYLNNSTHIDPEKNPFKQIDQWLSSTWSKIALTYNKTSGTQVVYKPYDNWQAPHKPTYSSNTPSQDWNKVFAPYLNNSTHIDPQKNPFKHLDHWIASVWNKTANAYNNNNSARPKPTTSGHRSPTKRPLTYDELLNNPARDPIESWNEVYGDKTFADLFKDAVVQSWKETGISTTKN